MNRKTVVICSRRRERPEYLSADYQLNWRKLQQVGLNAYEARSYMVLMGHARFKALELAGRAHVPRQKIYEVLDSLVEKGFAQVVQDKTKLFSAVDPSLAIPGFVARRSKELQYRQMEQERLAYLLIQDLREAFQEGQSGEGSLDFLSLVNDPAQASVHYRRMLETAAGQHVEFCRYPLDADPLNDQFVKDAAQRGIACRLLVETAMLDDAYAERLQDYRNHGVTVRFFDRLPLKLALFDNNCGLLGLLDPVRSTPTWRAVIFEHEGFGEAMSKLFESYWRQSRDEPCSVAGNVVR